MRKKEDDLIQLAFGDLKKEHADALRQACSADAEASETLRSYEMMREGLLGLKDIPEMQMSTERLRDAILKDGLKPHPQSRFNWNLLAWPVSLGLAATMGWMYLKPSSSTSQPILVSEDSRPVATNFDTKIDLSQPDLDTVPVTSGLFGSPDLSTMLSNVKSLPVNDVEVSSVSETPVRVKALATKARRSTTAHVAKTHDEKVSATTAPMALTSTSMDRESKSETSELAFSATPKNESPIVVIEPSPMATMSTDRAREVTADNVVVGG